MLSLKRLISRYMHKTACILIVCIFVLLVYVQIVTEQKQALADADRTFLQIASVLGENQQELAEIQERYRQTCLYNAKVVSRIIEGSPEVLESVEELKKIAEEAEIDEIHIFDETGRIFAGTHPEYLDYTFDSGEQMSFFKPLLEDKTLELVQGIVPNTAEAKLMQYSAVWSDSGKYIVQVGREPVNVMEVTKKNELSYIFSLFRVTPAYDYYAIDAGSGTIMGATALEAVGADIEDIGLEKGVLQEGRNGFYGRVYGKISFCVFRRTGTNYIGQVIDISYFYKKVLSTSLLALLSLITIVLFLANVVTRHINQHVVMKIGEVNEKLESIAEGNLDETVDVRGSVEFSQLSDYINSMVKSLIYDNKKMSYVLSRTNIYIGTYEYDRHLKKICYTEYIPKILSVGYERMEELASSPEEFTAFLEGIKEHPVENEQGVYKHGDQYVRLEEMKSDGEIVFGVAVDVTVETQRRIEIEKERDLDVLTHLYNRRGLDLSLAQLFSSPESLGYSAVVMIDADGLKEVNDTYGHEKGDIYLKGIGQAIAQMGTKDSVAARQGGDEFVLFLYGYDSQEELMYDIRSLEDMQSGRFITLDKESSVPLRFSFGYCQVDGETDYEALLREADEKMYKNKQARKGATPYTQPRSR